MTRTPSSSSPSFSPASSPPSASALFGPLTPLACPSRLLLFDDEATVLDDEEEVSEAAGPPPLEFPEHWSPLQDEAYSPSIAPGEGAGEEGQGEGEGQIVEGEEEGQGGDEVEEEGQGGDCVEEEGQGEQATCSEEEEAPQITAEAACSAARALGISLSTMLELPMAEWDSQVKHMWKEATLKHHPDKGGTLEQFHQLQHSYKAVILWLGQ